VKLRVVTGGGTVEVSGLCVCFYDSRLMTEDC
jgi:hypothetical protein